MAMINTSGVCIIGCGLIGAKRARALLGTRLVCVCDQNLNAAQRLAALYPGCEIESTWQAAVVRSDVSIVIVATTNDALTEIALEAVKHGKHVLLEKPAARSTTELKPLLEAAQHAGVTVKVGFNHRFHPGFQKARALVDEHAIGDLLYIRARYGHGGRLGYEQEWRAKREIAGGGEMLDQGVHLIDLARWFLGDFAHVDGMVSTFFWNMEVEDNGFAFLRTAQGQIAWLHASCTEWKNLFSFEIFGRDGKLQIEGLGGSYGIERLSFYRMLPQMGPPETSMWEYPGEDRSWHLEFEHFLTSIQTKQTPSGSLHDALAALDIVEQLYTKSEQA